MAIDPFELIARFFGIDPDALRRLQDDDGDAPDLEALSHFLGIDQGVLSDIQELSERDDVEWDAVFDVDVSEIDGASRSPRRSRRGVSIRPGRGRSPGGQTQEGRRRQRWTCATCQRAFLTRRALQRHYGTNPDHSKTVIDMRDIEPEQNSSGWVDANWVAFDDRVETFIVLSEEIEAEDIAVEYRESAGYVEVTGAHEETIDTSAISDLIQGAVMWRLEGGYLLISFPTNEGDSSEVDAET
ncbi:hypothetical protein E6P09_11555 [Haloferax mediterranei ATCC 33500]|uniref:C2H2-type domain-containing protein n=1 Tax=Haloferax mediterranei (strain ATCC 33500 / DSM 1411 / JCM 8866 / NBRC 14739 / NCIMB 2177 / R-4) TaxID=523841 RepID=I3R5A3_HALMT|nr:hypothetical protein [Haloferax mediterranei]AFK19413.1 hypothetical protein HFX_1707 [Haloferax mediterranei ATCC 33500]AHZ21237.1 hypothetical protein BM92_00575 [Haloferax mediterranei ATCC 33500]EMA04398.1 hypothetical protein C439_01947 [Haloferax mediterranei ATCC 33500]MDX5989516.1 hypothetical protein [Haloferax mediterranei ATCC 33500]QCQ75875.1 hypothetical protein E6P09_11555 [Haloferax mediterranei ATCC 33500]